MKLIAVLIIFTIHLSFGIGLILSGIAGLDPVVPFATMKSKLLIAIGIMFVLAAISTIEPLRKHN